MSVPTTSWDETSPAGSDSINAGDNRIRELKTQIREVIDVDHDFPSSGQATDVGQHKKVTLQEQADLGSGAAGATILGSQTSDGKGELFYTDEDDNDIQLSMKGTPIAISACSAKATPVGADLLLISDSADSFKSKKATITSILNTIYPVGIVVTLGVSTNPGTLFGIGTWTAIAGKVIVGINAGDAEFDTLDETGGSKTVDLSHNHGGATGNVQNGGIYNGTGTAGTLSATGDHNHSISSAGSATQSVLNPYIVKYVWQRTA